MIRRDQSEAPEIPDFHFATRADDVRIWAAQTTHGMGYGHVVWDARPPD
jgi:hypothetical protein